MTKDDIFRTTMQGVKRSLSPLGTTAVQTPLQQAIEVMSDLGAENIRLIDEVKRLRKWLRPSVVSSALLAAAFLVGAYTMQELANEQRLNREANAAQAQDRAEASKRDTETIRVAVKRAETAANAAQVAARAAAAEGLAAQADAIEVQAQIAPPSKREAVRQEAKKKREEARAARPDYSTADVK